jgi:hypothetical protein
LREHRRRHGSRRDRNHSSFEGVRDANSSVAINKPEATKFILGQTDFIKSVKDLSEALTCIRHPPAASDRFAERMRALVSTLVANLLKDRMSVSSPIDSRQVPDRCRPHPDRYRRLAGSSYYLWPRFESVPPQITVSPDVDVLGVAPLEIQVTDNGTGLRSVTATLSQGGTEHSLASEQFDKPVSEKTDCVGRGEGLRREGRTRRASRHRARRLAVAFLPVATRLCWRRTSRSTSRRPTWSSLPTTAM